MFITCRTGLLENPQLFNFFISKKVSNINHEDLTNFKMLCVIDWMGENVE